MLTLRGNPKVAVSLLSGVEGVTAVEAPAAAEGGEGEDGVHRVVVTLAAGPGVGAPAVARGRTVERCTAALVSAGIGVREVRASGGSLEEVFASLTQDAPAGGIGEKAS